MILKILRIQNGFVKERKQKDGCEADEEKSYLYCMDKKESAGAKFSISDWELFNKSLNPKKIKKFSIGIASQKAVENMTSRIINKGNITEKSFAIDAPYSESTVRKCVTSKVLTQSAFHGVLCQFFHSFEKDSKYDIYYNSKSISDFFNSITLIESEQGSVKRFRDFFAQLEIPEKFGDGYEITIDEKWNFDFEEIDNEYSKTEITPKDYKEEVSFLGKTFERFITNRINFKNFVLSNWKYIIVLVLIGITGFLILKEYSLKPIKIIKDENIYVSSKNKNTLSKKYGNSKQIFPKSKSKDSLYILITRFEEFKRDTINENNCVGFSISNKIDQLVHFKKLPIKYVYNEDIVPPRKIEDATKIQLANNADILIWGFSANFKEDCGVGEICFMSSPSENMIDIAGGKFVSPEKLNIDYTAFDSIEMQEKGAELHINGFVFESWLSNMIFLKTQKKKPAFFIINQNLKPIEISNEYSVRSNLYQNIGLIERAIKDLDSSINLTPKNAIVILKRARLYLSQNKFILAEKDYTEAIKVDPLNPNGYEERAKFYRRIDKNNFAEEDYTKAIKVDPSNPDRYEDRGMFYRRINKYHLAEKDYSKAINIDSLNADRYEDRAKFYRRIEKYDLAEKDYSKAIKNDSLNPDRYEDRAKFYHRIKNDFLAERDNLKAIELDPKNSNNHSFRARLYEKSKYDLAEKEYSKAINLEPLNYQKYLDRANFYIKQRNFYAAEKDFTKIIMLDSVNIEGYLFRAQFYQNYKVGKFKLAKKDLSKVIELNPNYIPAYFLRAKTYQRISNNKNSENYNLAKKDLEKATLLDTTLFFRKKITSISKLINRDRMFPKNIYLLFKKGRQGIESKNFDEAEKYFNEIISIDSTIISAQIQKAQVYFFQEKYETSQQELLKIINKDSSFSSSYIILGHIYKKQKKYEQAVASFSKSILINTNQANTYNLRGVCLDKLGYHKKAILDYKKAKTIKPTYYGYSINLLRSYLIYQYWYYTLLSIIIFSTSIYVYKNRK